MKALLLRIIKGIYYRAVRPFKWIGFYHKRLFRFILPNLNKIIQKKVTFKQYPVCNQKMLITGAGSVSIGNKCSFGYKLGGNYYRGLIEIQPRYSNSRINIGNNVMIAAKSGVINNVPDNTVVLGAPAIEASQGKRAYSMIQYLPEMRQNIRHLKNQIEKIAASRETDSQ